MKRGVGFALAGAAGAVVLAVGLIVWLGGSSNRPVYTPEWGVRAATVVMDARRGQDGLAALTSDSAAPVGAAFQSAYASYVAGLKAVDDQKIDIGKYYEENFVKEDTPELDEMDDPGAPNSAGDTEDQLDKFDPLPADQTQGYKEDPRIKSENGMDFMYVKDFDYSNGKYDIVPYKDANMMIEKGTFPQKYADLITDSSNYYTYDSYNESDLGTTDVLFVPVMSGKKNIIVRVAHTASEITGFEVVQ